MLDAIWDEDDPNADTVLDIEGKFVNTNEGEFLADIINPAGPIGYYGNYALYLKPEYITEDVLTLFNILKVPYLYYPSTTDNQGNIIYDLKDRMVYL